jgi:excisionase family DNA binding protein
VSRRTAGTTPGTAPKSAALAGAAGHARDSQSRLLGVEEAARYLGISSWTIRDLLANGALSRVRLHLGADRDCRRLLVDRLELDALIERSKERAPS